MCKLRNFSFWYMKTTTNDSKNCTKSSTKKKFERANFSNKRMMKSLPRANFQAASLCSFSEDRQYVQATLEIKNIFSLLY